MPYEVILGLNNWSVLVSCYTISTCASAQTKRCPPAQEVFSPERWGIFNQLNAEYTTARDYCP